MKKGAKIIVLFILTTMGIVCPSYGQNGVTHRKIQVKNNDKKNTLSHKANQSQKDVVFFDFALKVDVLQPFIGVYSLGAEIPLSNIWSAEIWSGITTTNHGLNYLDNQFFFVNDVEGAIKPQFYFKSELRVFPRRSIMDNSIFAFALLENRNYQRTYTFANAHTLTLTDRYKTVGLGIGVQIFNYGNFYFNFQGGASLININNTRPIEQADGTFEASSGRNENIYSFNAALKIGYLIEIRKRT